MVLIETQVGLAQLGQCFRFEPEPPSMWRTIATTVLMPDTA